MNSAFIKKIAPGAIAGWEKYKILPSVTIAQACLESNWGRSELAKNANNLFGIKAGEDWSGPIYNKMTNEQDKSGRVYQVKADFRKYPSWGACTEDHGAFFTSTPWRVKNYAKVVGETDYKKACYALKEAGYATDISYPEKLIELIERNNLTQYDPKGDKAMGKHLIIAGHGLKRNGVYDPGAVPPSTGYGEADTIRNYLIPAMKKYDGGRLDYITDYNVYDRNNIASFKNYDSITELHFNSSNNPRAEGVELCIYAGYQPDATDKALVEALAKYYTKRRFGEFYPGLGGFFPRKDLANCNACARAGITYRLVETCFISNPAEMKIFFANVDDIARRMVEAIVGKVEAPAPKAEEAPEEKAPKWYEEDWKRATEAGIVDGTRPDEPMTRAEYAVSELRRIEKARKEELYRIQS